jgi:hypothetical protein
MTYQHRRDSRRMERTVLRPGSSVRDDSIQLPFRSPGPESDGRQWYNAHPIVLMASELAQPANQFPHYGCCIDATRQVETPAKMFCPLRRFHASLTRLANSSVVMLCHFFCPRHWFLRGGVQESIRYQSFCFQDLMEPISAYRCQK